MAKTSKITATIQDAQLASIDAFAANYSISRSEALGRLVQTGLENLTRVEELKNFIIKRQEALEKKLQIELASFRKIQFMSLKYLAGLTAVSRTHFGQQFNLNSTDVEKLSDAGIAKMIIELKNTQGYRDELV